MKISIVMAVYNGSRFLKEQMDSLRLQTRTADEVVIADDCSTDQSFEIVSDYIREYQLDNWKISKNKVNLGYRMNFLHCIEKATGELIFLCDQDDVWEKRKIESMEKIMEKYPNIKVLNTAIRVIEASGRILAQVQKKNYSNANIIPKVIKKESLSKVDTYMVIDGNISPGCTLCFRKEIKKNLLQHRKYYESIDMPHDYYINLIAAFQQGLYFWYKCFTSYRIHENNTIGLSEKTDEKLSFIEARIEIGTQFYRHYKKVLGLAKEYGAKSVIPHIKRQIKYHKFRLQALKNKNLIKEIKSLKYRAIGCGRQLNTKIVIVDLMYIFGIRYH